MKVLLIALLLQSTIALPPRSELENPAIANPVPKQAQKDYDKLWKKFLTGKEDSKLPGEFDKLLKKNPDAYSSLTVQAYIDFYAGRTTDAQRRLEQVLAKRPADNISLLYLGELAYARGDFIKAHDLFTRLDVRRRSQDSEMKRQRSLLLGMETLWQAARRASEENRLADAERYYRQALQLAPREAALHGQLGEVLQRAGRSDDAQAEFRLQRQLSGSATLMAADNDLTVNGLEELGRWGNQIERFREIQISSALSREQLAALLAGYFPELKEVRQSSEVVTDIRNSWAQDAIRTVLAAGLLDSTANHTFQPAGTVTRGQFAQAIARLTRVLGVSQTSQAPITPLDVVPGSTLFVELQPVLGSGLLSLDNAGNFNVGAKVSGKEAVNTAEKLLRLIHKKTP